MYYYYMILWVSASASCRTMWADGAALYARQLLLLWAVDAMICYMHIWHGVKVRRRKRWRGGDAARAMPNITPRHRQHYAAPRAYMRYYAHYAIIIIYYAIYVIYYALTYEERCRHYITLSPNNMPYAITLISHIVATREHTHMSICHYIYATPPSKSYFIFIYFTPTRHATPRHNIHMTLLKYYTHCHL